MIHLNDPKATLIHNKSMGLQECVAVARTAYGEACDLVEHPPEGADPQQLQELQWCLESLSESLELLQSAFKYGFLDGKNLHNPPM